MNILLVGSGGREHALAWKIKQSPLCGKLFIAPGNPGMAALGELLPIRADDVPALVQAALDVKAELVVVGPEDPLARWGWSMRCWPRKRFGLLARCEPGRSWKRTRRFPKR